ncbi:MAG: hypothetical protein WC516_04475 [Patescibacteria group bacterium]|jgi:hypothetical protein
MIEQRISREDLLKIKEYGIIVIVPNSYISRYQVYDWITRNDAALQLIIEFSGIEIKDYSSLSFNFEENFSRNCLLVRITSRTPMDGLYEMNPGAEYVQLSLARCISGS